MTGPKLGRVTGPGSRNPDGVPHAVVRCIADGVANVGFEDKVNSDDPDFDDAVIQIRVSPGIAQSSTSVFQSPREVARFGLCEQDRVFGLCLPGTFLWQGVVRIDYDWVFDSRRQGFDVVIKHIDQSVLMLGANRPNIPCNIGMGISTDVFENRGGHLVDTLTVARPGSYIFPPTALSFGGITDPFLRVFNPRLKTTAVASIAPPCLGIETLQWTFDLPF